MPNKWLSKRTSRHGIQTTQTGITDKNTDNTNTPDMKGCHTHSFLAYLSWNASLEIGKFFSCRKPACIHCTSENTAKNLKTSAVNSVGDKVFKADFESTISARCALKNAHNSAKILLLGPVVLWKPNGLSAGGTKDTLTKLQPQAALIEAELFPQRPTLLVSFFFVDSSARSSSVGGPSIVPCSKVSRSISSSSFMLWVNLLEGHRFGETVSSHFFHFANHEVDSILLALMLANPSGS